MVDGAEKLYWERRVVLLESGHPEGGFVTLQGCGCLRGAQCSAFLCLRGTRSWCGLLPGAIDLNPEME